MAQIYLTAGWRLKNRLRDFFLIFAFVIFMVFRVYLCEKNHTSPCLTVFVVKRGRSQNMCDQYSLFCLKYIGKNAAFSTKFGFKKEGLVKF